MGKEERKREREEEQEGEGEGERGKKERREKGRKRLYQGFYVSRYEIEYLYFLGQNSVTWTKLSTGEI